MFNSQEELDAYVELAATSKANFRAKNVSLGPGS